MPAALKAIWIQPLLETKTEAEERLAEEIIDIAADSPQPAKVAAAKCTAADQDRYMTTDDNDDSDRHGASSTGN